jgi:exodeoxyribonuclease-1
MVVGNLKTLRPELAERWGVDIAVALRHAAVARDLPDLSGVWREVFQRPAAAAPVDVDQDLYGGFLEAPDRRRLNDLKRASPEDPAWREAGFDDPRLGELVFRYRARNWPASLSADEQARWDAHRAQQLLEGVGGGYTLEALFERIDTLAESASERGDERAEAILGALYDYADSIAPEH